MLNSLDDVELLESGHIGEGAFSQVFRCRLRADGGEYALKTVDISGLSAAERDSLRREIRLHAPLRHPRVVQLHDCLQEGSVVYMLMEYAPRGSLFRYIHGEDGLPEALALRFLRQVAEALKHVHDLGIVHRDVKPENVLLDAEFSAKLADFGCAAQMGGGSDARTTICGTYEYMPPEIIYAESHTAKADMWCLGMLLYEMLHGSTPFQAKTLDGIRREFEQKDIPVYAHFSAETRQLLRLLLASDARRRVDVDDVLAHPALARPELDRALTVAERALLEQNLRLKTGRESSVRSATEPESASAEEKFSETQFLRAPQNSFYVPFKASITTAFQRRALARPPAGPLPRPPSMSLPGRAAGLSAPTAFLKKR